MFQRILKRNPMIILAILFLLPSTILVFLFIVGPAMYAVYLSFTNASLARATWKIVGLKNFMKFLRDSQVRIALKNSGYYVSMVVIFQFAMGLIAALSLKAVNRGRGIYGAILFLPWVISDVLAVTAWKRIFNDTYGMLNYYTGLVGLGKMAWFADPKLAMLTCIGLNIWKGYPFSMIWELAGLQAIPDELYEAAKVDGATFWQSFFHITVPMMRFTMLSNFMLITMYTFNVFALIYALTGGGPLNFTEVIGLRMYKVAFESGRLGYGSSIALMMFLINLFITSLYLVILARRGLLEAQ